MLHQDQHIVAVAGFDRMLGWFCDVKGPQVAEEYDGLSLGKPTTLQGVLDVLIRHNFFSRRDLHEALALLHFGYSTKEIDSDGAHGVRLAGELVEKLKQGAGEG